MGQIPPELSIIYGRKREEREERGERGEREREREREGEQRLRFGRHWVSGIFFEAYALIGRGRVIICTQNL